MDQSAAVTESSQAPHQGQANVNSQAHHFKRLPKGERRVRFADSVGMNLVSIFLFDLISNYYFNHHIQKLTYQHKQRHIQTESPPAPPPPSIYHQPAQAQLHHNQPQQQQQQQRQTLSKDQSNTATTLKPASKHPSAVVCQYQNQLRPVEQQQQQQQQQQQKQHSQDNKPVYTFAFTQPIRLVSFKERVRLNKVHLETCSVELAAGNISVKCHIRVLNASYHKSVSVRYTTDEWHTFSDSLASYKPNSNDGWSDQFTSTFSIVNQVKRGGRRIVFAIRCTFGDQPDKEFWDNNGGLNYVVEFQ